MWRREAERDLGEGWSTYGDYYDHLLQTCVRGELQVTFYFERAAQPTPPAP